MSAPTDKPDPDEGATMVRERHAGHGVADPTDHASPAFIQFVEGPATGLIQQLEVGSCVVGRGSTAGITVDDRTVSREHVDFVLGEDGVVRLVDLGAKNGTYVNASRVDRTMLREGDLVEMGDTVIRLTRRRPDANSAIARESKASSRSLLLALSPRQLEVVKLVADGLSNAKAGQTLHISHRTVSTHLEHIYDRLGIRSRVELVKLMSRAGLLEDGAS
ncbi:MAG: FHA domain-containing protein [Nannocystaceae bacterium]